MSETLRPGSHESRRAGCKCDMARNQYGLGAYVPGHGKPVYELNPECPLHRSGVLPDVPLEPGQGALL